MNTNLEKLAMLGKQSNVIGQFYDDIMGNTVREVQGDLGKLYKHKAAGKTLESTITELEDHLVNSRARSNKVRGITAAVAAGSAIVGSGIYGGIVSAKKKAIDQSYQDIYNMPGSMYKQAFFGGSVANKAFSTASSVVGKSLTSDAARGLKMLAAPKTSLLKPPSLKAPSLENYAGIVRNKPVIQTP